MAFLNPYSKQRRAAFAKKQKDAIANKDARRKEILARKKKFRKNGRKFITQYHKELEGANQKTIKEYNEYIRSTKVGKEALAKDEEEE